MDGKNLIHLRIGYKESLESKRDILYLEKNLLNIIKRIKEYGLIREDELKIKIILHKKIKEVNANIRKIQRIFPKIKTPKKLKKEEKSEKESRKKEVEKIDQSNIELQLQEIQRKLNILQM